MIEIGQIYRFRPDPDRIFWKIISSKIALCVGAKKGCMWRVGETATYEDNDFMDHSGWELMPDKLDNFIVLYNKLI